MKLDHRPKKFAVEYLQFKGTMQYMMFASVALGVKTCFDDWIDISRYEAFIEMCKKYNLYVLPDVVFAKPPKKDEIIGAQNISTTFFTGVRLKDRPKQGEVHLIVSKSKREALQAKKFGWYSVVINNRSINKPFVDHMRYGRSLGFPDCCVEFFRKYNNWALYSHPYEAFKRTEGNGSYYCNNILMDHGCSFIHHIPCSFSCEKTRAYSKEVENRLAKYEPEFVNKSIENLKKSFLVLGERHFIVFDGKLNDKTISYKDCMYVDNPARPEENIDFYNDIREGNFLKDEGSTYSVHRQDKLIARVKKKEEWFLIQPDEA